MRFRDTRVLITGAGSGIGRATALAFAEEGAALMLADINPDGLAETLGRIGDRAAAVRTRQYDAGNRQACFDLADACCRELGGIDALCNIAGFARSRHFTDYSEQDWQDMLAVNLSGVFYLCQAAMPALLEGGGCIVNMASSAGITGQAYQASYCATKGGVVMLSKALAMEYAKRGVRVNAICPGSVQTPLVASFEAPEDIDPALFQRLFPLIEAAQPEEIAALVLYLCSDQARFVTGAAVPIDGGQTAG